MLESPLTELVFCAVDVETSGLSMTSRVIEVGAVRFSLAGECLAFQSLVNPCERIWRAATDIHGITDDMVHAAPRAGSVLPDLLDFMENCVFLAHNALFDVRMIACELARAGLQQPENQVLCTVRLSRKRLAGLRSYGLGSLVDNLGIDAGPLHRALPDARAAMQVFLSSVRGLQHEPLSSLPGLMGRFGDVARPHTAGLEPGDESLELPALANARLEIEMVYATSIERGPVHVTPTRVFSRGGHDYLYAYCHRDGIHKTYRIDRILNFRRA